MLEFELQENPADQTNLEYYVGYGVLLSDNGDITDHHIGRSWIQPKYALTYEDGDELIELAPPGDEDLSDLARLMQTRAEWRRRQRVCPVHG